MSEAMIETTFGTLQSMDCGCVYEVDTFNPDKRSARMELRKQCPTCVNAQIELKLKYQKLQEEFQKVSNTSPGGSQDE